MECMQVSTLERNLNTCKDSLSKHFVLNGKFCFNAVVMLIDLEHTAFSRVLQTTLVYVYYSSETTEANANIVFCWRVHDIESIGIYK